MTTEATSVSTAQQPDAVILPIIVREKQKSLMLRAWIIGGLFFMALPGTLLGFSNLMAISAGHSLAALPAAWLQGHGHAQMFGWIGSFVLGIGFYSQPGRERTALKRQFICFVLWTLGVALRWLASVYGWHWEILFPISAGFELVAILLFLEAASHHKLPAPSQPHAEKPKMELWMLSVLLGTAGLAAGVIFNFVECVNLALRGQDRAFPHGLDQRYLVLLGWGFLAPMVWGFSARWLHSFLSIPRPSARLLKLALALDIAGVLCGVAGFVTVATVLLTASAAVIAFALQVVRPAQGKAKVQGIHPSFPFFVRITYLWLVIAAAMSIWASVADQHGGIWGASRHALTVGFAATMVFSIGPRILPHFSGVRELFSKRLMLLSLLLLQIGCTLRVSSEPLAYEGILPFAWKTLPISGMLELSGVIVFAINIGLTLLAGKSAFAQAAGSQPATPAP